MPILSLRVCLGRGEKRGSTLVDVRIFVVETMDEVGLSFYGKGMSTISQGGCDTSKCHETSNDKVFLYHNSMV